MKEAPIPKREDERLDALEAYRVLDTLPEQGYDDLTFVASRICDTPIALISLVDADRQWFKSRVGLDATQTPRGLAFCAHAILEPEPLFVVEDALEDERFSDNPLVAGDPGIRFYAGAPLRTRDGHALGTLCVIDREPRTLSDEQAAALRSLSRQVMAQLELRRTMAELRDAHGELHHRAREIERSRDQLEALCRVLVGQAETIESDMQRAEVIQRSLLPREIPQLHNFNLQTYYRPGHKIGGDLFDVVAIDGRHVAMVIADAAGHGVSAAMLSVLFKHRVSVVDEEGAPLLPSEVLTRINRALLEDVSLPGLFVTAAACVLDVETREIWIASAGHPPVLWVQAGGGLVEIGHTGPALGLGPSASYFDRELKLDPGDRVFLYTDGLLDTASESQPASKTIAAALRGASSDAQLLERVLFEVSNSQQREDRDDVTMLLLHAESGESLSCEPTEEVALKTIPESNDPRLFRAETGSMTFVSLEGRVTWVDAQTLSEVAEKALGAGRTVVLDLSKCEYLDSTLLGILHALVTRSSSDPSSVRIQNADPAIIAAFAELSMIAVHDRLDRDPVALPGDWEVIALPVGSREREERLVVEAHEALASLSDRNRAEFGGVAAAMRRDFERTSGDEDPS